MKPRLISVMLLVSLATAVGCGRRGTDATYRVEGVVRLNGEPLSQGYVLFTSIPVDDQQRSHTARGEIGRGGHYRLTTFAKDDGAVAGRHKVVVVVTGGADPDREDAPAEPSPAIPEKYTSPQTTDLEVSVGRRANQIDIDLQ